MCNPRRLLLKLVPLPPPAAPPPTHPSFKKKKKTNKKKPHKTTNPSVENPTVKVDERGTAERTVRDSLMVTQLTASHNCQTSSTLKAGVADGRRSLILPSSTPPSPQEASFEALFTTATMISGLNWDKFGFNSDIFFCIHFRRSAAGRGGATGNP